MSSWLKNLFSPPAQTAPGGISSDADKKPPAQLDPAEASATYKKQGDAHLGKGNLDEAKACYQHAIALDPNYAKAHSNLGFVLKEQSLFGDAEHCLKTALSIDPNIADAHYMLGTISQLQGKLEDTIHHFRKALKLDPDLEFAYRDLCYVLFQQGKIEDAKQIISKGIALHPGLPDFHFYLGSLHKLTGELDKAAACYGTALSIQPAYVEAHFNLGMALQEQGNPSEALVSYRKAITLKPDYAEAHSRLGYALQELGQLDGAVASYRRVLEINPDYAEAHSNLGNVLKDLGQLDGAVASYRRALEIKPDFAEAHYNLGNVLRDFGQLDGAVASYRRALEIKPDFAEAHYNLGNVLRDLGQLDEAEASYRRALQIKPDYAEAHSNMGLTLKDLGRLDEALAHYRLSLNAKCDLKESLRRLTTPLVLHTGMVLTPQHATILAEAGKHDAVTTQEQMDHPAASIVTVSFAAKQIAPAGGSALRSGSQKNLRIILIYPPPWQIPSPGDSLSGMPFGPPVDRSDHNLDGDFQIITYGLLTIAAQAKRAGHDVSVYNLSTCLWEDVMALIAETEADVYGISAFTANRRGMGAVAALIRQHHPQVHITVGGPFVSALPQDTLRYYRDIDTAVIGEGEETFMDLLECLSAGRSAVGIPGTAWRNGEEIALGPTRQRIKDLDALASPFDYFTNYIVMTSRGCPSKCTFCGSFTTWGKMLRFHSEKSCLDIFKKALARLPVPFLAIKDDTFTAHRRRTIAICDAIIENKMNFMWSCDTRVDSLDDEMLCKMRLAGCQMISLGVESGSPEVLKAMRKETTPEMVLEATRSAQKYGMCVRYYMILINRGETSETIQQSIDLIKAGRPDRYFFCPLSFFPGTEDWAMLREQQGLTPDIFFNNDFKELSVATKRDKDLNDVLFHVTCGIGAINGFDYTVEEREAVVDRLPFLHSAHVELANAYFRAGRLDEAAFALSRAEELGFPICGLIYNQRACIALARNEVVHALALLERALQCAPHYIVMKNLKSLRAWAEAPVQARGKSPVLNDSVQALDFGSRLQSNNARPAAMLEISIPTD